VRTYPDEDAPLDELFKRLRQRFGRPQIVVPLLVGKITKPTVFSHSYEGLKTLTNQVLMGYDALKPHIADSLSQFLLYFAKASFDKPLKEDWEKYAGDKLDKPNLEDLRTFVDKRLLHMSPLPASAHSTSTSFQTTSTSTYSAPPVKKKSNVKCIACNEAHALIRCTTFVGLDVEKVVYKLFF